MQSVDNISYMSFRGVVRDLRNILYCLHLCRVILLFLHKFNNFIGVLSLFIDKSFNSENQDESKRMKINRPFEGFE